MESKLVKVALPVMVSCVLTCPGWEVEQMRFIGRGALMENLRTLRSYGVTRNCEHIVRVMLRPLDEVESASSAPVATATTTTATSAAPAPAPAASTAMAAEGSQPHIDSGAGEGGAQASDDLNMEPFEVSVPSEKKFAALTIRRARFQVWISHPTNSKRRAFFTVTPLTLVRELKEQLRGVYQ